MRRFLPAAALALALFACSGTHGPGPGEGALVVVVRGEAYAWTFRFAGDDGRFDTRDDRIAEGDLHLPVGVPAELRLESGDYVYTFAVSEFGVKEIAVPGLDFRVRVTPQVTGAFELLGDRMCGYDHAGLIRTLVVDTDEDFEAWLRGLPAS